MEKLNFSIKENYAVAVDGHSLDLHNDFDFSGLAFDAELNRATLSWVRATGDWVAPKVPKSVRFVFDEVRLFKTSFGGDKQESVEGRTLSFVGYLRPEEVEVVDGSLDEEDSDESFHMVFGFENGSSVKVYSDTVSCILSQMQVSSRISTER